MIQIYLKALPSLIVATAALIVLQEATPQPGIPEQPVVLVTRDGTGSALSGIVIDIARMGPPDEPYGQCTTDQAGECQLLLPPSAYVLLFRTPWAGQHFVSTARQNLGPVEEAGELLSDGFAIQVDFTPNPITFLFVIGRDVTGALVPLWDNAADRGVLPQPYLAPGQEDMIQLGSLGDTRASSSASPAQATRQVFVSSYSAGSTPTAVTPTDKEAGNDSNMVSLLRGLFALAALAVLVAGILWLALRIRRASRQGGT